MDLMLLARPESESEQLAGHALMRVSAPTCWDLAIQAETHPFHREWMQFRKWAKSEDLFVQLHASLHGWNDARSTD